MFWPVFRACLFASLFGMFGHVCKCFFPCADCFKWELDMFWWIRVAESCLQQLALLGFVCLVISKPFLCQMATEQRCDRAAGNIAEKMMLLLGVLQTGYYNDVQ